MKPTPRVQATRAFVDAMRGCLGLAPLYAADAPSRLNSRPDPMRYNENGRRIHNGGGDVREVEA